MLLHELGVGTDSTLQFVTRLRGGVLYFTGCADSFAAHEQQVLDDMQRLGHDKAIVTFDQWYAPRRNYTVLPARTQRIRPDNRH